jgi:hypothetical protein
LSSPAFFKIRNFAKYQHYRDRKPPWVKLYRDLWLDESFERLTDTSKLFLIGLFTIASECDNKIPLNPKWIRKRLAIAKHIDFKALIASGFIEPIDESASDLLAKCYMKNDFKEKVGDCRVRDRDRDRDRDRSTETEPLTPKGEMCEIGKNCNGKLQECSEAFERFWQEYPRHDPPRKEARKSWCKQFHQGIIIADLLQWLVSAAGNWTEKKFIPMPTTFLNQRRWEGALPPCKNSKVKEEFELL